MLWKIILSALLLVFSFPNFNLSFLIFIGFIPLFSAIENRSPGKAFLISYITGFIFYLGTLYWLYHVTTIGLIILCMYLALYFGAFGFILRAKSRRINPIVLDSPKNYSSSSVEKINFLVRSNNIIDFLLIPIIWVILEYIQANIPIMGFGWLLLGYSQYKNLPLIQIADFSGAYGVSFLIMMVNVLIWRLIRGARDKEQGTRQKKRALISYLLLLVAIILFTYGYGSMRLKDTKGAADSVRVSVIQGNIPQELKWDPEAQGMIIEKYTALTKMSSLDNPDLIVWPETSFPGFFEIDKEITDKVLNLAKEIKIPILAGVNTEGPSPFPLPEGERVRVRGYFNSAVLISREGKVIDKYDKIHLVPFGEYVPFSNKFPALHRLVLGELGEFTAGKDFKIFKSTAHSPQSIAQFGALICFEDIFPELSRRFVKNGAKFLIVITNDAWYGKSGAAYQHAACSVFRAIENRTPIVRCANTGVSCFIDSKGRIYASVEEKLSRLFITGYKTSDIKIKPD